MKGFIAALMLSAPMLANAYTWTNVVDFNPDPQITPSSSFSYAHDLTTSGFNPAIDTATDYDLTIYLTDSGRDWFDVVRVDQPGSWFTDGGGAFFNWSYASVTTEASYSGLVRLNDNGILNITVESLFGSFYLDASELVVTGNQGGASVPEPNSLALLAAGILGIVVMRRKVARGN